MNFTDSGIRIKHHCVPFKRNISLRIIQIWDKSFGYCYLNIYCPHKTTPSSITRPTLHLSASPRPDRYAHAPGPQFIVPHKKVRDDPVRPRREFHRRRHRDPVLAGFVADPDRHIRCRHLSRSSLSVPDGIRVRNPCFPSPCCSEPQHIIHQNHMDSSCMPGEPGDQKLAADRIR